MRLSNAKFTSMIVRQNARIQKDEDAVFGSFDGGDIA